MSEELKSPTNWPNPERPGYPMFPERDGWHVVLIDEDRREFWWDTECSYWTTAPDGDLIWTIEEAVLEFSYVGPCCTPAQIAEMLAAERERCAKLCEDNTVSMMCENTESAINEMLGIAATNIRNLGDAP